MLKYFGYAISAGFSLLIGDSISSHLFHLTVHYEPIAVFFRYIACFLAICVINNAFLKIFTPNKKSTFNEEKKVEQQPIKAVFQHNLPSIFEVYSDVNKLIDESSWVNEDITQKLKFLTNEIGKNYQDMSDDAFLNNLQLYYPEDYLFLKQEVIKLFQSFLEELNSLSKLEKNKVESFDGFKMNFITLMVERASMVNEKLKNIQKEIFEYEAQIMLNQAKANQTVLKAKI